jgi:uncharacterized protein YlxP (DUF503 family)
MSEARIFVGVLRMVWSLPGARTLKDRRQSVNSLRDRLRHKFPVTFAEVGVGNRPTRQVVVLTMAGNDGALIRNIFDKIVGFVSVSGRVVLSGVDVDVFRWHPEDPTWAVPEPTFPRHWPEDESDE